MATVNTRQERLLAAVAEWWREARPDSSGRMSRPTLLHFRGGCEYEVVPEAHLTDISWSERGREYDVLLTHDLDIEDVLAWASDTGISNELIGKALGIEEEE